MYIGTAIVSYPIPR